MKKHLAVLRLASIGFAAGSLLSSVAASAAFGEFMAKQSREQSRETPHTDRMIVKLRSMQPAFMAREITADKMHNLSATAGVEMKTLRQIAGGAHVIKLPNDIPFDQAEIYAQALRSHPDVEYAAPDRRYQAELVPTDPLYVGQFYTLTPSSGASYSFLAQQWYLNDPVGGINAPAAWDFTTGNPNLNIAVVDTGSTLHPDLNGRFFGGYDFISEDAVGSYLTANDNSGRDSNPADPGDWVSASDVLSLVFSKCAQGPSSWHGTAVAGIIGATSNNNNYGVGINWKSRLIPMRVLGKCGSFESDILDAVTYAAGIPVAGIPGNPYPAKVINISLGGPGACTAVEQSTYDEIIAKGVVVIGSAGNTTSDASNHSPAGSCRGIIAVAGTGQKGQLAPYSNFGTTITVSAPGGAFEDSTPKGGLLHLNNAGTTSPVPSSALNDDFDWSVGTSFAAPVVSGVVSLMLSVNPNLTPAQVAAILQTTARPFPTVPAGFIQCTPTTCGAGIVDASKAVAEANRLAGNPAPTPVPTGNSGGGCSLATASSPADISLVLLLGITLLWRVRTRRSKA
ncbi:MAG: S8 family peptidase [Burkholderiales bacterium]